MKNMKRFLARSVMAGLVITGCLTPAKDGVSVMKALAAHDEDDLPRETRRELTRARKATARYRDLSQAIDDGYVDLNLFVPNMGFHYLKSSLLNSKFDPESPELLVYAATNCNSNKLRLVAVEYAVPIALSPTPPEGFTGDHDEWDRNEEFGLWTLHAWIWFENPDGVFAELNPRVP